MRKTGKRQVPKEMLELAARVKAERTRSDRDWSIEDLYLKLFEKGYRTTQNKLYRLENETPAKVDPELIKYLELVFGIELQPSSTKRSALFATWIGLFFLARQHVRVTSYAQPDVWKDENHRAMLRIQDWKKSKGESLPESARIFILDQESELKELKTLNVFSEHEKAGVKCYSILHEQVEALKAGHPGVKTIDFGIFDDHIFEWDLHERYVLGAQLERLEDGERSAYPGFWEALRAASTQVLV